MPFEDLRRDELFEKKPEYSIILLGFEAEDGYGYSELQLYKQILLASAPSDSQSSRDHTPSNPPTLITLPREIKGNEHEVIYFDYDIMANLELHQTKPLSLVADIPTVAIHWSSFNTLERLEQSLLTVYSWLRNISKIVLVVDCYYRHPTSDDPDCRSSPVTTHHMPYNTVLEFEQETVKWTTIGRQIQQTIRNGMFWRECDRAYAMEQILPIGRNKPCVPQIHITRFARRDRLIKDSTLPDQEPSSLPDLQPGLAVMGGLVSPMEFEDPFFDDDSMQEWLD
ncbi:hypothetical protein ONZ43_g2572 [Nemania bipapillata]|uniref:Uncharacterized protein n=1 Tax=Nemania bipapillata TaxID=110536 RepID=A0ACC2J082_9PEZI|nr:hypothetical protein ONZ43_g2572 [Nemania bipapillata]